MLYHQECCWDQKKGYGNIFQPHHIVLKTSTIRLVKGYKKFLIGLLLPAFHPLESQLVGLPVLERARLNRSEWGCV